MNSIRIAALTFCACLAASSCRSKEVIPDGIEVVIKRNHTHTKYCGHYQHLGLWYYSGDHKHGGGCGHFLRRDGWYKTED